MTLPKDEVLDSLHLHLDSHPLDWTTRSILADRYEELGLEDHARYYRLTAWHGKSPENHLADQPKTDRTGRERHASLYPQTWFWWSGDDAWRTTHKPVAFCLIGSQAIIEITKREFSSRQAAEEAFMTWLKGRNWSMRNVPKPGGLSLSRRRKKKTKI